jgi:hypothetical protein
MLLFCKKVWLSFSLLLLAYASFGWFLSTDTHLPRQIQIVVWVLAFAWALFIDAALMAPLTYASRVIARWFSSDTVAFLTVFSAITCFAIVLFWLHIFNHIMLIISAEALARVDTQTVGCDQTQAFWLLAIVSLSGLGLGWGLSQLRAMGFGL